MSADFEITGAQDFYRVSKALKHAGQTGLRKELSKALTDAGKPLVQVAQDAASGVFPRGGGMAEKEAKTLFRAVTRTGSAATAGLSIQAAGRNVAIGTTNRDGRFRHPVHARKKNAKGEALTRRDWTWVTQEIPGSQGWFDRAMTRSAPLILPEIEAAWNRVVDRIAREVGA